VEQVHGVDDHGAVGQVLARVVRRLLHRLDGMGLDAVLPGRNGRAREVGVNTPNARISVVRDFSHEAGEGLRGDIVTVNEDGEVGGRHCGRGLRRESVR
jgi:hypothetical protein